MNRSEEWFFSVIDITEILTESDNPQAYWRKLKQHLKKELILNMLAEAATKDITNADHPEKIEEHIQVAKRGGNAAKAAKETLEKETGKPVITPQNAVDLSRLIEDVARADARAEDS